MTSRILAVLVVVSAVAYMDRQILAILIEPIKHDLGLSDTQAGLLYGFTFAAFYALLGIPIAKLADRTSRSRRQVQRTIEHRGAALGLRFSDSPFNARSLR